MGYFPNGSEGDAYEQQYCSRCIHRENKDGTGCCVWLAHLLYSYRDCNGKDSILHLLIPRSADGLENEQCKMFREGSPGFDVEAAIARDDAMPLDDAQQQWLERQMKKGVMA